MRKTFYTMILLLGLGCLAACSDDNSKEIDWHSPISIVNSNIIFEGSKASGGLRVQAPAAVTATTTASWCHINVVNGDSITVEVDENASIEGRAATIDIKSGASTLVATVQQKGLSFLPQMDAEVTVTSDKGVQRYFIKHTAAAKTWTDAKWLHPTMDGDSLVIAMDENTTPKQRSAKVYVQSGPYTDSLIVTQAYNFDKAYLCKYNLMYPNKGKMLSTPVELVKDGDGNYFLKFTDTKNDTFSDLSIPMEVDNVNMTLSWANLSIVGTKVYKKKEYKVITLVMGAKKGTTSIYRFSNGAIKLVGSASTENDKIKWTFAPNDAFDSNTYEPYLRLALSTDGTYAGYAKVTWVNFAQPYLEQAE